MKRADVLIIGAGLAGLQCARLLARRGISVLIADRKTDLVRPIHTTGIFVRRTLEDFDLPDALLGPPVRRVLLCSPAGRTQILDSSRDEFRIGRMGEIYRTMLRRARRSGAECLTGHHFDSIDAYRGETIVRFNGPQGTRDVQARFIVGADGAQSRVAPALGLSRNTEMIVGVEEILRGVPLEGPPALYCILDPVLAPGYIGWAAHDGEELHLGVGGYADSFSPARSLQMLRARVAHRFDLSRSELVERRGGRIPVGGILPRISSERGLLIGDAAGAVSPLTAGGLDGAMRLSRFAAEVLATAIERNDPRVLALYRSAEIETRFISRRWMRRMVATVRSPLLVEAGCALLRTPPFSALAWHLFFGRGSFPEPDRKRLTMATD